MRVDSIIALVLTAVGAGPASAQQDLCFHEARHVTCHFADGKTIAYDTDATAEFYNTRPAMTFSHRRREPSLDLRQLRGHVSSRAGVEFLDGGDAG